eukprot:TRINITY_DN64585_c0_g1_i2.p1 TRINITY_DN64585_c0_g1~~TRINITY_DN64585_c0_g1_i2.p1  ORF type:complete len:877 (+),score=219.93 TRINITY_DN64585_c0_g1_i2:105-2735(+)
MAHGGSQPRPLQWLLRGLVLLVAARQAETEKASEASTLLASVRVTWDRGSGSEVALELRLREPGLPGGGGLPDGWRLCFTWMKTIVLHLPAGATRMGSYVELPPEPALSAGEARLWALHIDAPAMRYASDLPQALHVVLPKLPQDSEERTLPVFLLPPYENQIRKDPDNGAGEPAKVPLIVPNPAQAEAATGGAFLLRGLDAGEVAVDARSPKAADAAKLLESWLEVWPPEAPLAKAAPRLARGVRSPPSGSPPLGICYGFDSPFVACGGDKRKATTKNGLSVEECRDWCEDLRSGGCCESRRDSNSCSFFPQAKLFLDPADPSVISGVCKAHAEPQRRHIVLAEAATDADRAWLGSEGYELLVGAQEVKLVAATAQGFHRAAASLKQTFQLTRGDGRDELQSVHIRDRPRFEYRGLMLDVARHFFPPDFIRRLLDWMHLLKVNVLHWHLTDDEGWRLEVKSLPNLTAHGAWRGRGEVVEPQYGGGPGRYGGFYTQEEVKGIVAYAAARGIAIVPEIDVPGHCYAAIRALPGLLGSAVRRPSDSKDSPTSVQGFRGNVLDPEAPATYEFLEAVFTEVLNLFPAELGVHIGMDEVPRRAFSDDPQEEALLLNRVAQWLQDFMAQRGRSVLGWEEAFYNAVDREAGDEARGGMSQSKSKMASTVLAWKEDERFSVRAANAGFQVVLSPAHFLYLDIVQGVDFEDRGLYWAAPVVTFERIYSYEPLERLRRLGLEKSAEERVRGLQAALWSETVATPQRAEEMLFPRLLSFAEVAWSAPERKAFEDFKWKLPQQLRMWQREEGVRSSSGMCGLVAGESLMSLSRLPPQGSGSSNGIAAIEQSGSCVASTTASSLSSESSSPAARLIQESHLSSKLRTDL